MKATRQIESQPGVILHLSYAEARVLVAVAQMIGGSHNGPRGVIDRLREELESVGIFHDPLLAGEYPNQLSDKWPSEYKEYHEG